MGDHARAAGFDLGTLDWPAGPAANLMSRMIDASVAWARQLAPRFDGLDVVVADCMVFGALMAARVGGVRCAAVMPTVYVAGSARTERFGEALAGVNHARATLGLPAIGSLTEQILDADRVLVLTSRAFELPDVQPPGQVRYVGPQLPPPHDAPSVRIPDGDAPLVLISLSTSDQGQLDVLRRLLAAVGALPVRALVTVGAAVDADQLDPPANVAVERFVPHAAVLPYASLVVTHAGHGTVMAAVSAGVPLVCVPMGRDQPAVAARVTRHGLGVSVEPEASVAELRSAITAVLGGSSYVDAARRMAKELEPAGLVVAEVEALARESGL